MLVAPPSTGKDFWIKQPYYSAHLKIQGLKTAHGEKCYSGSQANIVESGKKALTPIILLTSGTGSLVVCGKETLKKKKRKESRNYFHFLTSQRKQESSYSQSYPQKGFIAKCTSPSNELTCTSSHSYWRGCRVVRTAPISLAVKFSCSSGLAAKPSNRIPLFPSHLCAYTDTQRMIPINITAYAAVLTTGVERWCYPIFLDQLHYFIYNVEDRNNSKYCNDDAKDKAPI